MNGYGAYVWPSFAFAALVMACMAWFSFRSLSRARRSLAQLQETGLPGRNET